MTLPSNFLTNIANPMFAAIPNVKCQKADKVTAAANDAMQMDKSFTPLGSPRINANQEQLGEEPLSPRRKNNAKAELVACIKNHNKLELLRHISQENLFKLFIDANRWSSAATLSDPDLIFDRKEPGYMAGMMQAFKWMFETPMSLSADFISELHDQAVGQVGLRCLTRSADFFRVGYRNTDSAWEESFGVILNETITPVGLKELIERRSNPKYNMKGKGDNEENIFDVAMKDPSKTVYFGSPSPEIPLSLPGKGGIVVDVNKYEAELSARNEPTTLANYITDSVSKSLEKRDQKLMDKIKKIVSQCIVRYKAEKEANSKPRIVLRAPRYNEYLPMAVSLFISNYNNADKSTEENKLKAIARLVQDLDQLHPFYDGNIRTFVVLLMNKLLVDNGMLPSCMWDPNCVDGLSESELVEKIKEGQVRFGKLLEYRCA